ncbi:MAG TPA: carbohydrate kinase family protein [Acidimicrobiales bacterium]|nr:carbohydrate kinase family protein [Acidimicrobiales bacterium]
MGFVTSAQKFDIVSLGDVVSDEFIHLTEGSVRLRTDDEGRWLEIPWGTKLAIEDDSSPTAGGSAANTAVAMSRLGLRVGLASYLAHDQIGLDILSAMRSEDVDTSLIHVDSPNHTVRNFVLTLGAERTILVRHADFNYKWKGFRDNEVPAWLYINSLGPDALDYQDELADWLDKNLKVRLAFQPGTFQLEAGTSRLTRLYARAELLLCSRAAANVIAGDSTDARGVLDGLMALGASNVVVFDDNGGAVARTTTERVQIDPYTDAQPRIDLTGSGDAFASTMVAAIVHGVAYRDALRWAAVNAAATSSQYGTQSGLLRYDDLVLRLDGIAEFQARDL